MQSISLSFTATEQSASIDPVDRGEEQRGVSLGLGERNQENEKNSMQTMEQIAFCV
jgi:hypothetical protein